MPSEPRAPEGAGAGLVGHEPVLEGLRRARAAGRLSHALGFFGPAGIGKWRAARRFAKGLLCPAADHGPPCGACGACKRAASDQHPDQLVIDVASEGGEALRVHRIAERPTERVPKEDRDKVSAERFLSLVAAEGENRVVLVREAERANVQTQNAMLKMLEEPADGVVWILECARPSDLLPTVLSRVVPVPFAPLERADAARLLAETGLAAERAERLARWSGGSPGVALGLAERSAEELRAPIVACLAGRSAPLAAARVVWQVEGRFPGRTPRAEARERARAVLDLCVDVVLDRARADVGVPSERLRHPDVEGPPLEPEAFDALLRARADVDLNVTPEAAVERAFLALGTAARGDERGSRASAAGPMLERTS